MASAFMTHDQAKPLNAKIHVTKMKTRMEKQAALVRKSFFKKQSKEEMSSDQRGKPGDSFSSSTT